MSETSAPVRTQAITPHLILRNASDAIDFYRRAFVAVELGRMVNPQNGQVMHAELAIGEARFFVCDEFPEWGAVGPQALGGSPVTVHVYVEDVDAFVARAVEAGATLAMPVSDMFWGDRYGKVVDPFGHHWSIATPKEHLTYEQMAERMAAEFGCGG